MPRRDPVEPAEPLGPRVLQSVVIVLNLLAATVVLAGGSGAIALGLAEMLGFGLVSWASAAALAVGFALCWLGSRMLRLAWDYLADTSASVRRLRERP